jgi:hypothetical protein
MILPFDDKPDFSENSTSALLEELTQRGYEFLPNYVNTTDGPFGSATHRICHTRLFRGLMNLFNCRGERWILALDSNSVSPDWHVIFLTDETPIELEEYILAATSLPEAFGYILALMNADRIRPNRVFWTLLGDLVIQGDRGEIARIRRIPFTAIKKEDESRAASALRGLQDSASGDVFTKHFRKIRGFPKVDAILCNADVYDAPDSSDPDRILSGQSMLETNCSNLATAFSRLLTPMVSKPIPRHLIQEVTAHYCGFASWNHFTGAAKRRGNDLLAPFCLYSVSGHKPDMNVPFHFYRGLAAGLHAYGMMLISQSHKTSFLSPDGYVRITNRTRSKDILSSATLFEESEGIELAEIQHVFADDEYRDLAAMMLSANDIDHFAQEYLHTGLPLKQSVIEFDKRWGSKEKDHLFINNWVYWICRGRSGPWFVAENLSYVGRNRLFRISAPLYKAALIEKDDGFYLSNDWDRRPKHKLPNLDSEGAELIEQAFIKKTNWRRFL